MSPGAPRGIVDFRCRPPCAPFTRDWIFNLDDKPGRPGLRGKYARMDMPLPRSLKELFLKESTLDEFFREAERAGIARSVVPLRALPTQTNDDLVALLAACPDRFWGFAGVRPLADGLDACLADVERYVARGPCAGVYMEPGHDPVPWLIDDRAVFPLYDMCQTAGIPVCLLFGGLFHRTDAPDSAHYLPVRVERVARAFPRLRLILSHAGWPWTAAACAAALNWPNVYLSPDGFMIDHPGAQDYVVAANYRLQDKLLFASLYPSVPLEYAVDACMRLLRPQVWDKFFRDNALRVLGRD